jgi:hypothetical protein
MRIISINSIKRLFIKLSSKVGIIFLIFNKSLFRKYRKIVLFLLTRYVNYALAFIIIFLVSTKNLEFKLFTFTSVLFMLIIIYRSLMNKFNFFLNLVTIFFLTYILIVNL